MVVNGIGVFDMRNLVARVLLARVKYSSRSAFRHASFGTDFAIIVTLFHVMVLHFCRFGTLERFSMRLRERFGPKVEAVMASSRARASRAVPKVFSLGTHWV